jgi:DNA-binding CsgD family transcriptional regulator
LSPRDGDVLLRPGVAPGRFGAPVGASFFAAASRRRHFLQPQRRIRQMEDDASGASGETCMHMKQPMFLIDSERKIRMRNEGGADLLARRDLVIEHQGALVCRDGDSDRRVTTALRSLGATSRDTVSSQHPDRQALWLRRPDGGGAAATLHVLREEGVHASRARVLVTVFEPGAKPRIDMQLLATAYGLTSAEARLAAMIAEGHETRNCSRELDVKTSTLRSHLSSIYRKTGASGKADLVRQVLSLCAI